MNILYILKHNPWGVGGGCYACKNYLELFSEVFCDFQIDVLICSEYLKDRKEDDFRNCTFIPVPPRKKIYKYLIPFTNILHRHHNIARKRMEEKQYDFCIFDHNSIAGSLVDICKKNGVKTIVINHNCEIEYFKDNNSKINNLLLLPSVKKNECISYCRCDYNIFLTEEDKDTFSNIYGVSETVPIIGGCFLGKNEVLIPNNRKSNLTRPTLVISGTMGNVQNMDGINYFLDSLYSKLPKNVDIVLTGKNPPESLMERIKQYDNIKIIPNPKDILSIVKECDIFLCTTRLGGGMKYRIMDGIKCGLPILTHVVSARGYKELQRNGFMYTFEDETDFIKSYNELLETMFKRDKISDDIRQFCLSISFGSKVEYFRKQLNK